MTIETERPVTGLAGLSGVHELVIDGNHARFEVEPGQLDAVLRHVTAFGVRSLIAVAVALGGAGLALFRRRDLAL